VANLLTNLALTSAFTVTGSFTVITGMTTTVTIAGTGSVVFLMMTLNPDMGDNSDECAEYRFTHDGARVGPVVSSFKDATNEGTGRSLFFALEGLSAGSHTFAVEAANRSGTVVIDTAFVRTFQVVEIESGASILVDLETQVSNTVPSTYADMTNLSADATPNSASSLLLFTHGSQILGQTGQKASIHRFAIDGTQDGPEMSNVMDNVDETTGCTMVFGVTGVSATSQTFSVQHEVLLGTAVMDTARPRTFQVIEIESDFSLEVDVESVSADSAAAGFTDMTDMTGSPDIDSTSSIVLLLANYTIGGAADATSNNQFEIGTTLDGPEASVWSDAADRPESLSMAFAITGESGVTDVALQWQNRQSTASTNTSLPRTFQVIDLILAVSGAIAATPDLIFSAAADLRGRGQLSATAAMIFSAAADLRAKGQLSAAAALTFALTADLRARGQLTATPAMAFALAADLRAKGQLSATPDIVFALAADLRGRGQLSAAADLVFALTADLRGRGQLSATPDLVFALTADLVDQQAGAIAATPDLAFTLAADLRGRGQLTAVADLVFALAADLRGRGQLTAAADLIFALAADLRATGDISATANLVFALAADLRAKGNVSATPDLVFALAADLRGRGQLSATAALAFTLAADLRARGQLSATADLVFALAADLRDAAAGNMTATPAMVFDLVANLVGKGRLDAAALMQFILTADLRGRGQLSATPLLAFAVTANLIGKNLIDASPAMTFSVTADLRNATPVSTFTSRHIERFIN